MNVLKTYFDYMINQYSPIRDTLLHVKEVAKDGSYYFVDKVEDLANYQFSLGSVLQWKLNYLIDAGINPHSTIRTTSPTML